MEFELQEYGVATSAGARSYMEDFYDAHLVRGKMGLFGVYDGHGGIAAAEFCARNVHLEVAARMTVPEMDLHQVLTEAFLHVDQCLRQQTWSPIEEEEEEEYSTAGSTAVVALIDDCHHKLVVANIGDLHVILSRKGRAIDLARAHDPKDPKERSRIVAAGGKIMPNGYLSTFNESSTPSMSRLTGDFEFKTNESLRPDQQMVVALPEIMEEALGGSEDFLVLTFDGIWMPS